MVRGYVVVTESTIIHGVPLGANTYRVTVKMAVNLKACLPIPIVDEFVYFKDAIDTVVPWPQHLVLLSTTAKVKVILL